MLAAMRLVRKITIEVPNDLLRKGRESTVEGITATIRRGLEVVAASRACEELRRLRGHVRFSVDWRKLREGGPSSRSRAAWVSRNVGH
jgi:hypothetical protein